MRSNMNICSLFVSYTLILNDLIHVVKGSQSYWGAATSLSTKNRDVTTAPSTSANQKASRTGLNILGKIYQALVSR